MRPPVSQKTGDLLKNSAPVWCFLPKALTPDTVSTPQKAVPGPCCGALHPAPNQGNPPLFTCPGWEVLGGRMRSFEGGSHWYCSLHRFVSACFCMFASNVSLNPTNAFLHAITAGGDLDLSGCVTSRDPSSSA